jgi:hypothetical protein
VTYEEVLLFNVEPCLLTLPFEQINIRGMNKSIGNTQRQCYTKTQASILPGIGQTVCGGWWWWWLVVVAGV